MLLSEPLAVPLLPISYVNESDMTYLLTNRRSLQNTPANSSFTVKVPIAANWKAVCLQNTSKPHSYHFEIW